MQQSFGTTLYSTRSMVTVGHTLPASYERVGDHVRRVGLWIQHEDVHDYEYLVPG